MEMSFRTKKMDPVMYILVNSDLDLSPGAVAAQVGHMVYLIVDEIVTNSYEQFPTPNYCLTYLEWTRKCTKIILRATEREMLDLKSHPECRSFQDELKGRNGKVLTVIGFFPSNDLFNEMRRYRLY